MFSYMHLVWEYATTALRPKKINSSEWEKYETKVVGKWLFQSFFLFRWNLKNEAVMAQKPRFWLILEITSKSACFLALPTFLIFRFHKNKKNSNLNNFQQLLFRTFPLMMNFIFLVLVPMPRIFKPNGMYRVFQKSVPEPSSSGAA